MDKQMSLAHDTTPTVEEVMALWWGRDIGWASRKHIADALGRSKSPALLAMLGVCVGMGFLERRAVPLPNGISMFEYRPTGRWTPEINPF